MAPPGGSDDSSAARAKPIMPTATSLVTFCIVAFWAVAVDAGVVALLICPG